MSGQILHLEPDPALSSAKDLHDPRTALQCEPPDVLPHDGVREGGVDRVEVFVLKGVEKGLDGAGVVNVGAHSGSLVGHGFSGVVTVAG